MIQDLRIEILDEGTSLYVSVGSPGSWAKTTQVNDLVTVDWDAQDHVVGVEAIGSTARRTIEAIVQALNESLKIDIPEQLPWEGNSVD